MYPSNHCLVLAIFCCTLASLLLSIEEVSAVEKKKILKKPNSYLLKKPQCTEKRRRHLEGEMVKALPIGGQNNKRFPETLPEVQTYCR